MTVTVQPNHEPSTLKFSYANPDPETEFVLANETVFPSEAAFRDRIRRAIRAQPFGQREATIFVHDYNATHAETAFRSVQGATGSRPECPEDQRDLFPGPAVARCSAISMTTTVRFTRATG